MIGVRNPRMATEFQEITRGLQDREKAKIAERYGLAVREVDEALVLSALGDAIFINSQYVVYRREDMHNLPASSEWPAMVHLLIRSHDQKPIHDWRDLQSIKNAIVGPEHEAIELYPRESRVVDTANVFHLWVLADSNANFPFGYPSRVVRGEDKGAFKQRGFQQSGR